MNEPTTPLEAYRQGNKLGFNNGHKQGVMFAVMRLCDLGETQAAERLAKSLAKSHTAEDSEEPKS